MPSGNFCANSRRVCVYTALIGQYEELNEQPVKAESSIPFICFTDDQNLKSESWEIRQVSPLFATDPIRSQRDLKLRPHVHLSDYDASLYIDNSVLLAMRPEEIFADHFPTSGFSIFEHSFRDSVLDEFLEVARLGFDDQNRIFEQLNHYAIYYPEILHEKPFWGGFLLRDHRNSIVCKMLEIWLFHVYRYSRRDQLSVNVAFQQSGLKPDALKLDNHNSIFHSWPHIACRDRNRENRNPSASLSPLVARNRLLEQAIENLTQQHKQELNEQEQIHKRILAEQQTLQKEALADQARLLEHSLTEQAKRHDQTLLEVNQRFENEIREIFLRHKQELEEQAIIKNNEIADQARKHQHAVNELNRQHAKLVAKQARQNQRSAVRQQERYDLIVADLQSQREAILSSTSWKVVTILRDCAHKAPNLTHIAKRGLGPIWRAVTLPIHKRLPAAEAKINQAQTDTSICPILPPEQALQNSQVENLQGIEKNEEHLSDSCLSSRIEQKWKEDSRYLPLTPAHRELYEIIHRIFWTTLNDFPNLIECRDFNDRMQWLKLFDQNPEIIRCSDKILVREFVKERVGERYLVELYQTHDHFSEIDFESLPNAFVLKTNHDSGNVILVRDKATFDKESAEQRIESSLKKLYGWEKGEWAYSYIVPKVLIEEFIDPDSATPPPDYKFFCVDGVVKFIHYIYDRGPNSKEQAVDPQGNDLHTRIYIAFQPGNNFVKPDQWDEMLSVAATLSRGFKFVRVDLYCNNGKVYVGEMTFWPMCGLYDGDGQKKLGPLLAFDRTTFRPFLLTELKKPFSDAM